MADPIVVLLVDDDADDAHFAAAALADADPRIEVETTCDPEAAVTAVAAGAVDCVVAEYDLDPVDGLDLLDRVREDHPHLPFVLFTDARSEQVASDAVAKGATDYVSTGTAGTEPSAAPSQAVFDELAERVREHVAATQDGSQRGRRDRERYETLIELMPDTVVVTDLDGTVVDIYGFGGRLGYDYDELVGADFSKPIPAAHVPRVEALVADLLRSDDRTKATFETVAETKDGETIYFENHLILLPPDEDGEVPGTMSVLRDVTERVAHERQLQRQNERLEEFAGIVSHDLRNPLNVARTRLDLAMETGDSDHLEAVDRAHDRMTRLIEDLLALAQEGDAVDERRPVDLASVAATAWQSVDADAATLEVEADVTVEASESRLRQLLVNLFGNAVEHGTESQSPHGGDADAGDAAAAVGIRVGTVDEDRGFFVADDGPGIPPDERHRVLESGYTTADDGTGYGLSIVQDVAADHGWDVAVTASAGGGARFEITLDEE